MSEVYLSCGYERVPLRFVTRSFTRAQLDEALARDCEASRRYCAEEEGGEAQVRLDSVARHILHGKSGPSKEVAGAHASYNAGRFNGPVVRFASAEYWTRYLATNAPGGSLLLEGGAGGEFRASMCLAKDKRVAGRLRVTDFFCSEAESGRDGGAGAFLVLLCHWLRRLLAAHEVDEEEGGGGGKGWAVKVPKPLATTMAGIDWGAEEEDEEDAGQMYRPVGPEASNVLRLLGDHEKHLCWGVDGF